MDVLPENRKRVVFFVSSLEVGGIETYLLRFIRYAGTDIKPIVICKSGRLGRLAEQYLDLGVELITLNLGYALSFKYVELYGILKKDRNVEVVCDFTGHFGGLVMLVSALARIKNRITFYRGSEHQFRKTPLRLLLASVLGKLVRLFSTCILSNSESALDKFHPGWRLGNKKIEVIRNPGPDLTSFNYFNKAILRAQLGIPDDGFVVVHIGRVAPAKNHDYIFAVANELLAIDRNIYFILCGRDVNKKYRALIDGTEVAANYRLFDHRDDLLQLLGAADVFFFPSINEGMPNALLEAMAVGCPCVASNILPIREIFPPRYFQYLVNPHNVRASVDSIIALKSCNTSDYSKDLAIWTRGLFGLDNTFGKFLACLVM